MSAARPGPSLRSLELTNGPAWDIEVDGRPHEIELGRFSDVTGAPRHFQLDEVRIRIGGLNPIGSSHSTDFTIDGRSATMSRKLAKLAFPKQLRRVLGGSLRALPATIIAYALGGPGVAGGVSGAAAVSGSLGWVTYTLTVDEVPQGSWVVTLVGQEPSEWSYVPAGGTLPDGHSVWRPGIRSPSSLGVRPQG